MIMASVKLFEVQILDHIIVNMDSDAYQSFANEKVIDDTKNTVMAIKDQFSNLEPHNWDIATATVCF